MGRCSKFIRYARSCNTVDTPGVRVTPCGSTARSADTPGKLRDPPVDMRDKQSMRWPLGRGIVPEHCAMAYDTFLAACITHPQTIALHQLLIGPNIRFDHNTLLSRRDFPGQHWHSHSYMEDGCGVTTRPGGASLRLVRSLIYPDGFADRNDGGLKVVPGAHLFRSATLRDSVPPFIRGQAAPGQDDDKYFESNDCLSRLIVKHASSQS